MASRPFNVVTPHVSLMCLTTSPQKSNICVYFMVSFVYSGLSFLVCLFFPHDVHILCLQTFVYLSFLFFFVFMLPFLLFLFSSLLSTSASSALHMGMIVCTPVHQFELLTFTQYIPSLLSGFLLASPIYESPFVNLPFYLYPNVPLVLSKALSNLRASNPLSVSQVQPFFISSVSPSGSYLILACGCVCVSNTPPPPPHVLF